MSNTIDNAVLEMDFDNGKFQRGVAGTMSALDKLKSALKLDGAAKGLQGVDDAAKKISLSNIASGVDSVVSKFSALSVIAITALANIATKAIQTGATLVKSLTITPLKEGLQEYELNLNSIQTILANTQASGATLKDVNKTLDELNHYSDDTIYNFAQMAKNIGTFTAAGVDLKTSAASIKGIANLAALSGSNSEQAAGAMYQLSQAIASGKVSLMDWNSVVNAGMGGTVFQRALAQTAVNMGKLDKNAVKISGSMKNVKIDGESFRDSISASGGKDSWLTSDVLTKTLSQFTGDLTDAQLKAEGFSAAQIKAIQAQAQTAKEAATQVKTFSALVDTTKEAVVSGWSESWRFIFGDFEEAKKMWSQASKVVGDFVKVNSDARNKLLGDWKALGGRTALIDAVKNAFQALVSIITPIKAAFRDIFPAATGKQLADITKNIRDFFKSLKIGEDTAFKVRRVFQGFFALLDIGRIVITDLVGVFVGLFGDLFKGSGGFLDFAAKVGDWITALRYGLKYGEGYLNFLITLNNILKVPIEALRTLGSLIVNLFKGNGIEGAAKSFGRLQKRLEPFKALGDTIAAIWGKVMSRLDEVFGFMQPFADAVSAAFTRLGIAIRDSISTGDFSGILDSINTGLFGGLVLVLKKFLSNGLNIDFGGGILGSMNDTFGALTDTLGAMQQQLKANALLKIAGAIGLLAVSVGLLALIDSAALTKALAALTVMFIQLGGAMAMLDKIGSTGAALKLPVIAGGLILLAIAIDLLVIAVKSLADLSWEELMKGLTGVTVLLAALTGSTQLLAKNAPGMITAGIGLAAVAIAIKILASAVQDFSTMDWGSMIKGLVGVSAALTALALFTRLASLSKMGLSSGAGLVLLAASLKLIASAVKDFGGMDWVTLGKGFASMAVALGLIAAAVALLPAATMLSTATGLLIISAALVVMAQALKMMGSMSWEEIGKSMVVLAGALGILAIALNLMAGTLPGSAAVLVMAAALAILTPVLMALGSMSWEEIVKGLATLAGVFVVLGLAGLALGPVVPILLGLGAAVALIGIGLAAAGAGVFLFATGLTALSAAGAGAAVAITAIVSAIIGLIPMALKALAEGIVLFAKVIGDAAPTFVVAMTKLIGALLQAISNMAPKIISTLLNLLLTMLRTIGNKLPQFIDAGVKIITGYLDGIAKNIPKVVASALNVVTTFLKEVAKAVPKFVAAGYKAVIDILNGITQAIDQNSEAFGRAGGRLAVAIIRGMVNGIKAGGGEIWNAAQGMASNALNSVKSFLGINSPSRAMHEQGKWTVRGFADGLDDYANLAGKSAEGVGHEAINAMRKSISGLDQIVADNMEATPVIRPVLDLTSVKKDSAKLGSLLPSTKLSVGASYSGAANALKSQNDLTESELTNVKGAGTTLTLIQNNNSPKALSNGEIYRQTNNQISTLKGVLAKQNA